MTLSSSNKGTPAFVAISVAVLAVALAGTRAGASAQGDAGYNMLRLDLPVACDMVRDCSIQKYVDRAEGPERLDYHCGRLTTDGHGGTDFRLRRFSDFGRNVKVVAAAAGTVLRVRDGMMDVPVTAPAAQPPVDLLAGNAVVMNHGNGWETQYSHLKRGSVRVRPGARVAAGTELGVIGMSGNSEFPHLHFTVRRNGQTVDPFAAATREGCGKDGGAMLWSAAAARALPYRATVVLAAGFAASAEEARTNFRNIGPLRPVANPQNLLLWGNVSGVQSGDVEIFRILAPNGGVLLVRESPILRSSLHWVNYTVLRRPREGWQPGRYRGIYQLTRNGALVGEEAMIQDFSG